MHHPIYSQDISMQAFEKDLYFSNRNPAVPFDKKFNIGFPEGTGYLFSENNTLSNWLNTNNANGSRTISLQNLWSHLERKNYNLSSGYDVRTVSFGVKFKRIQFNLEHKISGDTYLEYNKDLVGLIAFGNYGLLNKEPLAKSQALDIGPSINTKLFQSIGIDAAFILNEHISIGGGVSFLSGLFSAVSDQHQFKLDIHDPLTLSANENWSLRTADLVQSLSLDSFKIKHNPVNWSRHPGVSFKLGIFTQNQTSQFSLQVRDLGFINWDGTEYSRNAITTYSGLQINDFLKIDKGLFDHIQDTIKNLASVHTSNLVYKTSLSARIIANGLYHLGDHWSIGGTGLYALNPINPYWKIMPFIRFTPSKIFSINGNLSIDSYSKLNAGLAGYIKLSVVHLYMGVENLPVLVAPDQVNRFAATLGLSVSWGK